MESVSLLDRAGRRRSPATLSSFHQGLPPRNKGLRYPPDPPTVQEIVAVMAAAGDSPEGIRLRGVIVVGGVPGYGSPRPCRSLRPTWSRIGAHWLSATARVTSVARSGWTDGDGRTIPMRLLCRLDRASRLRGAGWWL
jgi:hypothetical protein